MQALGVILFIFREPIFCNKYTHTHTHPPKHTRAAMVVLGHPSLLCKMTKLFFWFALQS